MKNQQLVATKAVDEVDDVTNVNDPYKGLPENKIPNKKIEKCFFEKVIIFV
ncbi:hypothetical protein [Microcystis aeruginosa]|uniref:hypothetical protein n=1 Tax=Microcystis aeruginosa TaxID=1126 RepID=UPI0015627C9B|nr:hypothetical protein [Microcystis aeruginosa]